MKPSVVDYPSKENLVADLEAQPHSWRVKGDTRTVTQEANRLWKLRELLVSGKPQLEGSRSLQETVGAANIDFYLVDTCTVWDVGTKKRTSRIESVCGQAILRKEVRTETRLSKTFVQVPVFVGRSGFVAGALSIELEYNNGHVGRTTKDMLIQSAQSLGNSLELEKPPSKKRAEVCATKSASDRSSCNVSVKRSRSPVSASKTRIIVQDEDLPQPQSSTQSPDQYLSSLVSAMFGFEVEIIPALELDKFFTDATEEQMAAYSSNVVSAARDNNVDKLRGICAEEGREALNCFNRFGEGLLNLACRRGFVDLVKYLLGPDVDLQVRICDDYGRTPLHDACWHPEPQTEICAWLLKKDPSLFLIADKRGFTPFQYARPGDWATWRNFLWEHREHLTALCEKNTLSRFS